MPVEKLYVEGKLDWEIWGTLLSDSPLVESGGGKDSLKPQTIRDIMKNQCKSRFLRDRDFDYDPPSSFEKQIICWKKTKPIGIFYMRHEIENYLIDPQIVAYAKPEWDKYEYKKSIWNAADKIKFYEVARWVLGIAKRKLPHIYDFKTKPVELDEYELKIPNDSELESENQKQWVLETIEEYSKKIELAVNNDKLIRNYDIKADIYSLIINSTDIDAGDEINTILINFSGKDLLAAMSPWLDQHGFASPGSFRDYVRIWIRNHPSETLDLIPEWKEIHRLLTT